jgi:hypothetical protein
VAGLLVAAGVVSSDVPLGYYCVIDERKITSRSQCRDTYRIALSGSGSYCFVGGSHLAWFATCRQ